MLKVIGSGLGRTGTLSLKRALEHLGFSPCYHALEPLGDPYRIPQAAAASRGQSDWRSLFQGYVAAVDYPANRYWFELAKEFPQAKVIHTVRNPDDWFDSTQATIFDPAALSANGADKDTSLDWITDRGRMIEYFNRHTAQVEAAIPQERRLTYQVGEGWGRLCAFLDVPLPEEPFPRENTRHGYRTRYRGAGR